MANLSKNIDLSKLTVNLAAKKSFLVSGVIAVVALVILAGIFNNYKISQQQFNNRARDLEQKNKVIADHDKDLKKLNDFLDTLPQQLKGDQAVQQLTDYAQSNAVEIVSVSPGQNKVDGYVSLTDVRLTVASDDYKNIVRFIRALEQSEYALRVDAFKTSNDNKKKFRADIQVTAVGWEE